MRLWSIHPKYLDSRGLVALWWEGLLAQKVLAGKTKGYKYHPQLTRFRDHQKPMAMIGSYLSQVENEASSRGYRFDRSKIKKVSSVKSVQVTRGQMRYEMEHLLRKLKMRDPRLFQKWSVLKRVSPCPLFKVVPGKIEKWEVIPARSVTKS